MKNYETLVRNPTIEQAKQIIILIMVLFATGKRNWCQRKWQAWVKNLELSGKHSPMVEEQKFKQHNETRLSNTSGACSVKVFAQNSKWT